jgi:hypothetical protein
MDGENDMAVYFIQGKNTGNVKIGFTRSNATERLRHLLTCSAEDLDIIKEFPGGTLEMEKDFHQRFKRSHIIREWFRYDPEISIYLGDLSDFDRMNLFRLRMFDDSELQKSASGYLSSWLFVSAELAYYKGVAELQDFLDECSEHVDMARPVDDMEIQHLTRKRWELYAKKNG